MPGVVGTTPNIPTVGPLFELLSLFDIIVSDETLSESLITQKRVIIHYNLQIRFSENNSAPRDASGRVQHPPLRVEKRGAEAVTVGDELAKERKRIGPRIGDFGDDIVRLRSGDPRRYLRAIACIG